MGKGGKTRLKAERGHYHYWRRESPQKPLLRVF
jgi:hypothetical protein